MIQSIPAPMRLVLAACLIAASGTTAAQQPPPSAYQAALTGGNYMHNFYLPPPSTTTPRRPAWSPDGETLAFALHGSIWRIRLGEDTAYELTDNETYDSSPVWSPDG